MAEIHVTVPPHGSSNSSAMHASSVFPSSTPAVTGAGAGAGVAAGAGAGAGVKAGPWEGMANPMDPHQANRKWDGLAQLVECLKSPRRHSQRETVSA